MKKTVRLLLTIALLGGGMVSAQNKDAGNDNSEGEVFNVVEEFASFPGGQDEMYKFIAKNLQYPEKAEKKGIEGKVYVSFIVEADGSITNVKVLRDIGSGCGEAAVRVVKSMPKWNPAKQRGKYVRMQMTLPFAFMLSDKNKQAQSE